MVVRGEVFTEPSVRKVIITGLNSGRTSVSCAHTYSLHFLVQFLDACIHTFQSLVSGGVGKKSFYCYLSMRRQHVGVPIHLNGLQCKQNMIAVQTIPQSILD